MRHFRSTVGGLMGLVVFLALGLAAVKYPTPLRASLLLNATLGILIVALIGAVCAKGRNRVSCAGFAIAGWAYLCLIAGPGFEAIIAEPHAIASVVDWIYHDQSYAPKAVGERVWQQFNTWDSAPEGRVVAIDRDFSEIRYIVKRPDLQRPQSFASSALRSISREGFRALCHSLIALVMAAFGGILARLFAGE